MNKLGDGSLIGIDKNIKKEIDDIYFSYKSRSKNFVHNNQYTNLISRIWKKDNYIFGLNLMKNFFFIS